MKRIIILIALLFATTVQAAEERIIEIPDDLVELTDDSFADIYNRPEMVEDPKNPEVMIPNPIPKEDYFYIGMRKHIRDVIRAHEVKVVNEQRQEIVATTDARTENIEVRAKSVEVN